MLSLIIIDDQNLGHVMGLGINELDSTLTEELNFHSSPLYNSYDTFKMAAPVSLTPNHFSSKLQSLPDPLQS